MSKNENIDPEIREPLNQRFGGDPLVALDTTIKKWLTSDANFSILGIGGGAKRQYVVEQNSESWQSRADKLMVFIREHIDDSTYYIVFDELQEDYGGIPGKKASDTYFNLLKGLIRAVVSVKASFSTPKIHVFPVILLRDDIYDLIVDADKSNWDDFLLELTWTPTLLRRMLNHRVSADTNLSSDSGGFLSDIVQKTSRPSKMTSGYVSLIDWMIQMGHHRPRDIIKFLQISAEHATVNGREVINTTDVAEVTKRYSAWFKQALHDEIHPVLPEFSKILDVFAHLRKTRTSSEEFGRAASNFGIDFGEFSTNDILDILYYFSVIGVRTHEFIFRYLNRSARLVHPAFVQIHPGLQQSILF